MAENEAKEGEEGAKPAGGGIKALLVPILSSAVTAAIVGVVFMMMAPKPAPAPEEGEAQGEHGTTEGGHGGGGGGHGETESTVVHDEAPAGSQGKPTGIYQKFDSLIVTIFDHEQVHYLKAGITLELAREEIKEEITAKDPQIRDSIIFILGDFTMRELLDNQGKTIVKESMIKTLNKILGPGKIVNVYFAEYTVQ